MLSNSSHQQQNIALRRFRMDSFGRKWPDVSGLGCDALSASNSEVSSFLAIPPSVIRSQLA